MMTEFTCPTASRFSCDHATAPPGKWLGDRLSGRSHIVDILTTPRAVVALSWNVCGVFFFFFFKLLLASPKTKQKRFSPLASYDCFRSTCWSRLQGAEVYKK